MNSDKLLKSRKPIFLLSLLLLLSFSTFSNAAFAAENEGLFATDDVDEGLRIAADAGFVERVNVAVTDEKLTFQVEDVVADSSRVAFSYRILNRNGEAQDVYLNFEPTQNDIYAVAPNGKRLDIAGISWSNLGEYGLCQLTLPRDRELEKLIIKLDLKEVKGTKGNWQLEIPVDLKKSIEETKIIPLRDASLTVHGVHVKMKEVRFAPTTNEIMYETTSTKEEKEKVATRIKQLEDKFGNHSIHTFSHFGTEIQYHLENEDAETFMKDRGQSTDLVMLQGSAKEVGKMGTVQWRESFIPSKRDDRLTFVLDGVFKTVPADFSIKMNPDKLKKAPISFDYEGNSVQIKEITSENEYSLAKSILPVEKESYLEIKMEGEKEASASEFVSWILVDEKGESYLAHFNSSTQNDKKGRYKIRVYGIEEIPEELTLQLISAKRYFPVEKPWRVPLY